VEVHVHRLFTQLISGNGTRMNVHPELDIGTFPEAQYIRVFSEENTEIHFEHELIDMVRPLPKSIFLVGSVSTEERPYSYSIPYSIDSKSGEEWDRNGHSCLVHMSTIVRITMIVDNKVPKQASTNIHYMQLFAQQAIRNPPTQDWWGRAATLLGFTGLNYAPSMNLVEMNEEEILSKWFGARFSEVFLPEEHIALRKL